VIRYAISALAILPPIYAKHLATPKLPTLLLYAQAVHLILVGVGVGRWGEDFIRCNALTYDLPKG